MTITAHLQQREAEEKDTAVIFDKSVTSGSVRDHDSKTKEEHSSMSDEALKIFKESEASLVYTVSSRPVRGGLKENGHPPPIYI